MCVKYLIRKVNDLEKFFLKKTYCIFLGGKMATEGTQRLIKKFNKGKVFFVSIEFIFISPFFLFILIHKISNLFAFVGIGKSFLEFGNQTLLFIGIYIDFFIIFGWF